MTLKIRLLGSPSLQRDGDPIGLKGRKSWALLTYLMSSRAPQSREHLAELLFSEANDPLRALRWNLTELRRATGAVITGDPVTLTLPDDMELDVEILRNGTWDEAASLDGLGRDLIEGIRVGGSPAFETWLLVQQRQIRAATEAILREGALTALAARNYETAIDLAARLVASDPLQEEFQAILIRSYVASGDRLAAARQGEACTRLLHRELGVEPGPSVTSALAVSPASATTPAVGGRAAARAQLEAGRAAVRSGVYDAGIECLRRAMTEAHSCGDTHLKAETLCELGSVLVHSGRNLRTEGAAALHEALGLARSSSDAKLEVRVCYELAWNDFLDARYDRAQRWLDRALEHKSSDELTASILWVAGKMQMETGHFGRSVELLEQAIEMARRAGDLFRLGFALASLGRTHLIREDSVAAGTALRLSLDIVREGAPVLVPVAEGFLAQVRLLEGDLARGLELAQHAYAYALEVGDVSMIGIAARPFALADAANGHVEQAVLRLRDAVQRFRRSPDHTWTFAYVLDALCDITVRANSSSASEHVDEMEDVVGRGPMTEMVVRALLHRAALGDEGAASAAAAIALDIDNASLGRLVEELRPGVTP